MKNYHCYGLVVASELDISSLTEAPMSTAKVDVVIKIGSVSRPSPGAIQHNGYAEVSSHRCLVTIPDVARFEIGCGKKIVIEAALGADPAAIEAYLLGTVFGILIHQRGDFPFHASVVKGSSGAIAFSAPSGSGKSSLAAYLARSVRVVLMTDDMGRISSDEMSKIQFYAGPKRLKLWEDSAAWLGMPEHGRKKDLARERKFHYGDSVSKWVSQCELSAIVYLKQSRGAKVELKRAIGKDAIRVVLAGIYRPTIGAAIQNEEKLFMDASGIAGSVDVYMLSRPWGFGHFESVIESLHLAKLL